MCKILILTDWLLPFCQCSNCLLLFHAQHFCHNWYCVHSPQRSYGMFSELEYCVKLNSKEFFLHSFIIIKGDCILFICSFLYEFDLVEEKEFNLLILFVCYESASCLYIYILSLTSTFDNQDFSSNYRRDIFKRCSDL